MIWVGAAILVVPMTIATMIWRGYVLSILWAWFVVPTFEVSEISAAAAMGLSMLIGLAVMAAPPTSDSDDVATRVAHNAAISFLTPLIALGIGWVLRGYI